MLKRIMAGRAYHNPGIVPWVFIVISLISLVMLGLWQLDRLTYKEALLAQVADGQTLPEVTRLPRDEAALKALLYRKVKLKGQMLHGKYYLRVSVHRDYAAGFYVLTPMKVPSIEQGDEPMTILLNRGFISGTLSNAKARLDGYMKGNPVTVTGVLRPPHKARLFTRDNVMDQNLWFYEDVDLMGPTQGISLAPYVVEVSEESGSGIHLNDTIIHPNSMQIRMRNDHLGYAVTWFGLAIVALVMFWFYCYRREDKLDDLSPDAE